MKKIKLVIIAILFFIPVFVNAQTMSVIDITNTDIYEIQEYIDNGYLTYEELTRLYLERIEEYDSEYNSIISINENAIEEAKKRDIEYAESGRTSLLFGIPIIIKDNIDYVGLPTTGGSLALSDNYPKENSFVVEQLLIDKAIILGKSNMSEFAFSASESLSSYGIVKNSYNTNYSSYGSSGGSAVAASLSFATLTLGTDTNSSVRLPASANGLVGLRPTYDLIDTFGVIPYDHYRDVVGTITKNVTDNAIMLSSIVDIDYTKFLTEDGLKDKKIGVIENFTAGYNEELTLNAIDILDIDAEIVYIDIDKVKAKYYDSLTAGGYTFSYWFDQYIINHESKITSFNQLVNNGGYIQYLAVYNNNSPSGFDDDNLTLVKEDFIEYIDDIFEEYELDAIVYPSSTGKTVEIDSDNKMGSNEHYISPVTGYPAITVPMGYLENLPYGIEFVAQKYGEPTLYEIAYAFESKLNLTRIEPLDNLYEISTTIEDLIYINNKVVKNNGYDNYYLYLNNIEKINLYLENYTNNTDYEKKLYNDTIDSINNFQKYTIINDYPTKILIIGLSLLSITLISIFILIIKKKLSAS